MTLIKPEMYNILIATSQHTSLFFPLHSFLLPAPTALLRPVADSGLVKSSNLSYTWHSRGSLRCQDSDSKEKVKKATGRIFDQLKIRTFTRIRNHDFSRKPQHGVATLLRYCLEWLQHCSNIATLYCSQNRRYESFRVTSPLQTVCGLHEMIHKDSFSATQRCIIVPNGLQHCSNIATVCCAKNRCYA